MNRLKELRKEKKQTQKEFAKETGTPLRTLQSWENGESQIKPDKAQQLAEYFGVNVGYLLGYDPEPVKQLWEFDRDFFQKSVFVKKINENLEILNYSDAKTLADFSDFLLYRENDTEKQKDKG